jgi:hypothetical protein
MVEQNGSTFIEAHVDNDGIADIVVELAGTFPATAPLSFDDFLL